MPTNGQASPFEALRWQVSSDASGSHTGAGTGVYTHSASSYVRYTPDTVTLLAGWTLNVGGSSATDEWTVFYEGPGSSLGGDTWTGSGWATVAAEIVIEDLKFYGRGSDFRLVGSLSVYVQGVLEIGPIGIDEASAGLGPAYVPLFGVPMVLSGSCGASTTGLPSYGPQDPYSYSSTCTAEASGGWGGKEIGEPDYVGLPMTVLGASAPGVASPCEDPGIGSVSADDTMTLSVSSYAKTESSREMTEDGEITACVQTCTCPGEDPVVSTVAQVPPIPWERYKTRDFENSRGGEIMAMPDCQRAIKRFNPDFMMLCYRTEMPQTTVVTSATCDDGVAATTDIDTTEVHPHQAEILDMLTNVPGSIEDTLGYHGYAPATVSGSSSEDIVYLDYYSAVLCGDVPACSGDDEPVCESVFVGLTDAPPDVHTTASRSVSFPSTVGPSSDMAGYLGHSSAIVRYINSWGNPLWSFAVWTEPPLGWEVDGSPETWADYWQKVGSQWISDAYVSRAQESRNHLVSEGLENDAYAAFCDSLFGELRWIGVSRWQTKAVAPRASYQYGEDQESLMEVDQGTLSTSGTTITITPP